METIRGQVMRDELDRSLRDEVSLLVWPGESEDRADEVVDVVVIPLTNKDEMKAELSDAIMEALEVSPDIAKVPGSELTAVEFATKVVEFTLEHLGIRKSHEEEVVNV